MASRSAAGPGPQTRDPHAWSQVCSHFFPIQQNCVVIRGAVATFGATPRMLSTLRIKNLALVADLTLELQPGYNAISGETGAGKSILIGALTLVLGGRADRNSIRSGADTCAVEAVFAVQADARWLPELLSEHGLEPCEDGLLVLKRTTTAAGANRQFVNGSPTTLATLALLGDRLVDIHGPHDHQSLLHPARQLDILDAFGNLNSTRAAFADLVRRRAGLLTQRAELIVDEQTYARQLELLRHQVREINEARLQPDEEHALQQEYQRASNGARLLDLSRHALGILNQEDGSLLHQAGQLGRVLLELQRVDTDAARFASIHAQTVASWHELQNEISRYADRIDLDAERLQQLEERLNLVQSLKRKYGQTLTEVLNFGAKAQEQLRSLEDREGQLAHLERERQQLDAELIRLGSQLHHRRRKVIPALQKAVMGQLADLGFNQCRFEVSLVSSLPHDPLTIVQAPAASGFDRIEFQFAPNPGEPPRPLRAIASSGEMARVMLALKTVLAVQDEIPLLVFDEVDANVGGETAHAIGRKMSEIGQHRQVLCITHLAPVAACAYAHFVVTKVVRENRSITGLHQVEGNARVSELARMLGGGSAAALQHAQALLEPTGAVAHARKQRKGHPGFSRGSAQSH
jgi:DNA repair protein RecN (Recombination protein N)